MLTTMNGQESVRLTMGWSFTDETDGTPILSHLYGEMVKRAIPVVQAYHGDLFHDAEWLRANVKGECEFWWMVRACGTNLGESAITMEHISSSETRVLYHVALTHGRLDAWTATFTEVVRVDREPTDRCGVCQIPGHDTCPLVIGCSCCVDTITRREMARQEG